VDSKNPNSGVSTKAGQLHFRLNLIDLAGGAVGLSEVGLRDGYTSPQKPGHEVPTNERLA
jgi:hypothetical protein